MSRCRPHSVCLYYVSILLLECSHSVISHLGVEGLTLSLTHARSSGTPVSNVCPLSQLLRGKPLFFLASAYFLVLVRIEQGRLDYDFLSDAFITCQPLCSGCRIWFHVLNLTKVCNFSFVLLFYCSCIAEQFCWRVCAPQDIATASAQRIGWSHSQLHCPPFGYVLFPCLYITVISFFRLF